VQQFAALMRGRLAGRGYRLLYTWSRDGRSSASFHQRCDNQVRAVARARCAAKWVCVTLWGQGPTLVVVRSTTGHTFGGYAHAPWTSVGNYTNTAGCFLFLVENPHNDAPTCFECKSAPHAMNCSAGYGPTFGGGHDLCIHPGDAGQSYTNFPNSSGFGYTDTLGRGAATFTGAQSFTVEDYEVWAVT